MKTLKILFPTDFSDPASLALRYTLQFANGNYTTIEMIHMLGTPAQWYEPTGVMAENTKSLVEIAKTKIRKQYEESMAQIETKGMLDRDPSVKYTLEYGEPVDYISAYQKINNFDFVALGTTGEAGKAFGSFASNLLMRVNCNVLVIPDSCEYREIRNIVFATDFKDSDPYYITEMLRIVEPFQPTIHFVHVTNDKGGPKGIGKEGLLQYLRDNHTTITCKIHEVNHENIEEGILEFSDHVQADLISMVAPKYGVIKTLLHRSHTKKMASITTIPLLVLKEK